MSELDKKLNDIVFHNGGNHTNSIIAEIKQAFTNDGWVKLRNHEPAVKCYTGEEWYERFEKELSSIACDVFYDYMGGVVNAHSMSQVVKAAKKASGLNNPSEGEKG